MNPTGTIIIKRAEIADGNVKWLSSKWGRVTVGPRVRITRSGCSPPIEKCYQKHREGIRKAI